MIRRNYIYLIALIILLPLVLVSCSSKKNAEKVAEKSALPDTLRVGTLYSPTSFFEFRGDTLGYEYERICSFARDKKVPVKFVLAHNMSSMIEMLDSGLVDIVAYEVPITAEYKNRVLNCGTENITYQVLVQPKSDNMIKDVTDLIGRDVFVEKDSKYESRLRNLDNELGGGIKIHSFSKDSLISEDLIAMVAEGSLPLTIVDSDIAKLNKTYYDNIDISLQVSYAQRASWAVRKGNESLAEEVDKWASTAKSKNEDKSALKRYFELSKNRLVSTENAPRTIPKGGISPYDDLFRKYSKELHWDWRLLAAQAWCESNYDTTAVSWAGARGLMQLMPRTAKAYGLNGNEVVNPELNLKAAVAHIKDLDKMLAAKVPDKEERKKFILASYNSGIGHIYDAIALANKYGKNPRVWYGNVEEALMWKSNPEYFNDEVCRFGYFRGKQTVTYVVKIMDYYNKLSQ